MFHRQDSRQQIESIPYESLIMANQANIKQCLICLNMFQPDSLIIFGNCGHSFCKPCLSQHLSFSLRRYNMPKCPEQLCEVQLSKASQVYEILDENQRKRYQKIVSYLYIIKNPNYLPCQKENCTGLIDKNDQKSQCNLCKEKHCPKCHQLAHNDQCQAIIAMEFETREKFRQCNKCGQIIEKIQGCTHMQCPCGHYFCYSCGQALGNRQHQCVPPAQLNFLEAIRWSIEHEQLWFQSNELNFLRYLLFVSPPRNAGVALQVAWSFSYLFILYPISMAIFVLLSIMSLLILCLLFLIFTFVIPFMPLFSQNLQLWPSTPIFEQFGMIAALTVIIIFYPILYFLNSIQFFSTIIEEEELTLEQACLVPIELLKGIRNMTLMPCLMLIDNEKYYLALGHLRQQSLLRQQQLIDQLHF